MQIIHRQYDAKNIELYLWLLLTKSRNIRKSSILREEAGVGLTALLDNHPKILQNTFL